MALPNVTPEQRAKALEKAAQVRKARKELLFLRLVRTILSSVK